MRKERHKTQYDSKQEVVSVNEALQRVYAYIPDLAQSDSSVGRYLAQVTSVLPDPQPMSSDVFNFFFRGPIGDKKLRLLKLEGKRDRLPEWHLQLLNGSTEKRGSYLVAWSGTYDADSMEAEPSRRIYFHALGEYDLLLTEKGLEPARSWSERGKSYDMRTAADDMANHPGKRTRDIRVENGIARFLYADLDIQGEMIYQEEFELPLHIEPKFV